MATTSVAYNSTDWNIWTFVPQEDTFILDFSLLDSSDPLGTTPGAMTQLDLQIGSISLQEGSIVNGILPSLAPATLQVGLIVENFTKAVTSKFNVGATIWLTLKHPAFPSGFTDPVYGLNTPLFFGTIRDFSVSLQPGSNIASIVLQASSTSEDLLNSQLEVVKNDFDYKTDVIFAAIVNKYPDSSPLAMDTSSFHYADNAVETKTLGEWLTDFITCEQYIFKDWIPFTVTGTEFSWNQYLTGYLTAYDANVTFDSSNVIDLQLGWDSNDSPTGVALTNYKTPSLKYNYSPARSNAITISNFTATVDVKDATEMAAVATNLLRASKSYSIISFTALLARDNQNVVFTNSLPGSYGSYLYPELLLEIGWNATLDFPEFGFSNLTGLITGRRIEVTPYETTIQYDFWKGITR